MTAGALAIFSNPHVWFIKALQFLQFLPTLLVTLLLIAIFLWGLAILVDRIACIRINPVRLPSCCQSSWSKPINSIGIYLTKKVGRALCPLMFPGLFTEHKMRAQAQESVPEVYIAFLNRNLNDHFAFLLVFSLLSIVILAASGTAFLTSFSPVPTEAQCLEEDKFGHSLICYTDSSAYPANCGISQSPPLCDTEGSDHSTHYTNSTTEDSDYYSNTTNIPFQGERYSIISAVYSDKYTTSTTGANVIYTCYPWTIQTFGVAFASAMGVFKFAIFFTTAVVKIGDWCIRNCSSSCKIRWICKWTVIVVLGLFVGFCLFKTGYSLFVIVNNESTDCIAQLKTKISEFSEYTYLPVWLCSGLAVVIWYLEEYCKRTEFNTLSPDQLPPPLSPLPPPPSPLPR